MILDVFSKLHDEGITNWSLDIYGAGALENECTQLAKKLSDNVIFHGRGEHEHVMRLLKEKDFCLMPSLIIETFGLSALESLRAGTPVIGFQK